MHRLPMIGLACLALAFVAGCGSDDKSDSSSTPAAAKPAPAQTATSTSPSLPSTAGLIEVTMKDIKFVPHIITAKVGQKIVWTNDDTAPHNVTATDGADFASETINNGQTYEYTPKKAGVIKYVCTIHSGQDGEIRVSG
jgi:plastocyanin